ncbi:MAG: amino acid ABC transporter permease/ATP-binding protein [Actinomycetota bacterium]|nr:amino acid ABC transporter permease/ATP-binding protein [Actinomycetota bacterium]
MEEFLNYVTLPFLWRGLLLTVEISVLSLAIAWPLAVLLAAIRSRRNPWLRALTSPYIWIMRGTPILLQLIFWYNFLPEIGLRLSARATAIVGLALSEVAFSAEIIRGGMQAVPPTQPAAAAALGMNNWLVLRRIVLPQALRAISPALANNAIVMIKNTSLASVISVGELTLRSQQIVAANFRYVPVFLSAGALYLVATSCVAIVQNRSESRIDLERRGVRNVRATLGREGATPLRARRRGIDPSPEWDQFVEPIEPARAPVMDPGQQLVATLAVTDGYRPALDGDGNGPFVVMKDVEKSFHGKRVLRGVSLEIERGEVVVVVGPSGAGKTTLLYTINHLEPIDRGEIRIGGRELTHRRGRHRGAYARTIAQARAEARIGIVFQRFNLFDHMTVLENIMEAPLRVYRMDSERVRRDAESLLAWAGLLGYEDHYPHQLSGGQQQRVAIVRALACRPKLMLFDEPTSALDPQLVGDVLRLIRDLAEMGMTMVVVTHELAFAREVATEIVFMADGRVVERGAPDRVLDEPCEERTQEFLKVFP